MNKKEYELIGKLANKIYYLDGPNKRIILVISKYAERTRVNLFLLKFFLQEMKLRGIFITVDRPHHYIGYLLKLHGIPQNRLLYIDVISKLSGECLSSGESNVYFSDGPYEVNFLENIIAGCYEADPVVGDISKEFVDLKEMDFILIDNIAALAKYMDSEGVKEFINSYTASIDRLGTVAAPIVLDINKNKQIYMILKENCDRVIFINLMKSIVKEVKSSPGMDSGRNITGVPLPVKLGLGAKNITGG